MKNYESMCAIRTANSSLYFILRETMRNYAEKVTECINSEVIWGSNNPANSAKKLIEEIGKPAAILVVASLINAKAWDGRISKDNAEWAASVEDAFDEETVSKLHMVCTAHPTHLNALAAEFHKA